MLLFSFSNVDGVSLVQGKRIEGIHYAFSTRKGGVTKDSRASLNLAMKTDDSPENVKENWKRFLQAADLPESLVFYGKQTHGTHVKYVTSSFKNDYDSEYNHVLSSNSRFRCVGECDGLWTDERGITISVFTADCVPVFIVGSKDNPFVAAVHGGWRGLTQGIIEKTLSEISSRILVDPSKVTVIAGPHICSCCFEVSTDVASTFNAISSGSAVPQRDLVGKYLADLGMIVKDSAVRWGIPPKQVFICEMCTCCNEERFFSYRRTKTADRGSMSSGIALV